jgi:hypothetical protein
MTRINCWVAAACILAPLSCEAGWGHHHHHHQAQIYYSAAPTYYVPVQGAAGDTQSGPLLNIVAELLRRYEPNLVPGNKPVVDQSLRADIDQLKTDVATLGLRLENANSILQTQGKAIVDLQAEFGPDGELRKILDEIRTNTKPTAASGSEPGVGGQPGPTPAGGARAPAARAGERSLPALDRRPAGPPPPPDLGDN